MNQYKLLLGASLFFIAGVGEAQASGGSSAPAAEAGPVAAAPSAEPAALDEIVVTAQRRSELLQNVPLTITALSSTDVAKAGVTSLRDIQNVVSGFTFGGQGTVSQPSIRGVSTLLSAAGSENPNALYIDGIYQATAAVLNNELPDLERVEVLKGPQGTLFGRNATGGAIQVFTRQPSFTPTASVTLDGSYYTGSGSSRAAPRGNARAFVSGPIIPDLLAASISGGYSYTDGFFTNDADGTRIGTIRKANGRAKLLFTPGTSTQITLGAYYVKNVEPGDLYETPYQGLTAASAYPGSVVSTRPWHTAFNTDPTAEVTATLRQYGFSGRAVVDFDFGTLTSLTGYNNTVTNNPATSVHNAQGTLPCLFNFACLDYAFLIKNREISQEFDFSSRNFGIFNFVTGLFYYNAKGSTLGRIQGALQPFAPTTFPLTVQANSVKTEAYAAFGEVNIKPTDTLTVTLGLRQNHEPHKDRSFAPLTPFIKKTFDSTTPRASVRFDVTKSLNVYGTFSIGYKSGLTGATNVGSVPPFASVAPEKLYAYEAGVKYATGALTFNGSFFYYNYKNKQEQTFTGTSTIIKNTGPVRIYGFDFDANARLTRELNLRGSLSYIPVAEYRDFPDASGQSTARIPFVPVTAATPFGCAAGGGCGSFLPLLFDASGMRLSRSPKVTANGTLSYATTAFDASTTVSYSSAVLHDITGTIRQPAYVTVAAQIGYRLEDGLRVGIFGRNLTNKAYIVNGLTSSAGFAVGYAPPRELGVSVNYTF